MPKNAIDHALFNVAVQHHQFGRWTQAEKIYREILAEQPKNTEVLWVLGGLMGQMGRRDEAIKLVKRAVDITPKDASLHYGLGCLYGENNQLERAVECYREALRLNPNLISARFNMGTALQKGGNSLEAIAAYREVMRQDPHHQRAHSNLIMTMHQHPGFSAADILAECREWDQRYGEPLKKFHEPHANVPDPERRLRIGYLSSDLYYHPVARYLEPLLAAHDRGNIEVFCYADVVKPDDVTKRLRSYDVTWRSITGMKDADVAKLIRRDGVDILVDLGLHSDERLIVFAYKPAPVQVSYLGYCSTTGLSAMDYRLSDPYLDPEGDPAADAQAYSEESVRLPETYWCYPRGLPEYPTPRVNELPVIRGGAVTFGSMNNFAKVSQESLATWAKLLEALPESRLIIHAHAGDHRDRVIRTMRDLGIGTRRLEFMPYLKAAEYFQKYHQIDIALDPFPQCGGTTTCDALYMGVPVITIRGKTAVGRGGVSLLSNVGLGDLVAENETQYIEKAVALASDVPRLGSLRASLRQRMEESPLMNAPRFAQHIEAAYRMMWRRWCAGRKHGAETAMSDTQNGMAPATQVCAPPPAPAKSLLNVGGGTKMIAINPIYKGWRHHLLDIDPRGMPDVVKDARELDTLDADIYDAVYCAHNLEHYHRHEAAKVVRGFHHVLKEDGWAEIHVPDLEAVMQHVVKNGMDIDDVLYKSGIGPILVRDVIYGFHGEIESTGQDFYGHKTGFTAKSLARVMKQGGFAWRAFFPRSAFELCGYFFKREPAADVLKMLSIASVEKEP